MIKPIKIYQGESNHSQSDSTPISTNWSSRKQYQTENLTANHGWETHRDGKVADEIQEQLRCVRWRSIDASIVDVELIQTYGSLSNVHGEVDREPYPRSIGFPQRESHRAAIATAAAVLPPIPAEPPKQHLPLSWWT